MAKGIYVDLDETTLSTMETDVLAQIALVRKGSRVQSVSMGGKTVTKSLPTMEELQTELEEILYAKKKSDEDTNLRRNFVFDFRSRKL